MVAMAIFSRRLLAYAPLAWSDLAGLIYDPWAAGMAIQGLFLPVALLYLLSSTDLFRRAGEGRMADRWRLVVALAAIQASALMLVVFPDGEVLLAYPLVVIGGWLGGWRSGLSLGVLTMVGLGLADFARYYEPAQLWAEHGMRLLLDGELWLYLFFLNLTAVTAVWAGLMAGVIGVVLDRRRFEPVWALVGTAVLIFGSGLFIASQLPQPGALTTTLLGVSLIGGLAAAGFMLLIGSAQAEVARRRAKEAELALAQAELRALRAQINPHFLFNALNTIRFFVRTDPASARCLLGHLSVIFQRALRAGDFVSLADELAYVEAYLALETARFGERLQVCWRINQVTVDTVKEATLPDGRVPTLILQPIVENAVLHGLARQSNGGQITISLESEGSGLLLQVTDTGPGMEPARLAELLADRSLTDGHIGLRNVDGRLRALYGCTDCLEIMTAPGRGTTVKIRIPETGDQAAG